MTLLERFNAKWVENPETGCWDWTAARDRKGYGVIGVGGRNRGSHRVSYELHVGPIPEGEGPHGTCVCHRCDNPKCVRPDHLFLGTNADNMRDMADKGRSTKGRSYTAGEKHGGSRLTKDDVDFICWALPRWGRGGGRHLARFFGVSDGAIYDIKHGRSWTDVSLTTEDSK